MSVDVSYLKKVYDMVGISPWIIRLYTFLVNELGLPEEYLPSPLPKGMKIDFMKQDILHSGNFGFYACHSNATDSIQETKHRSNAARSIFQRFWLYVRYAPGEACWFPFVHIYSFVFKYITL